MLKLIKPVPPELWHLIVDMLIDCHSLEDPEDILHIDRIRYYLWRTSKHMRDVVEGTQKLWRFIDIRGPSPLPFDTGVVFAMTKEYVEHHIRRSDTMHRLVRTSNPLPLNVACVLPHDVEVAAQAMSMMEIVAKVAERCRVLYFHGQSECGNSYLAGPPCVHASLLKLNMLPNATNLRILSVKSEKGERLRCHGQHPNLVIDSGFITSVETRPLAQFVIGEGAAFRHLTHMDVLGTAELHWKFTFEQCKHLRTLVWRALQDTPQGSKPYVMNSLVGLKLVRVDALPPIVAPSLSELTIDDRYQSFHAGIACRILGHAEPFTSLVSLELIRNPISNHDASILFGCSPGLRKFRISCFEVRSELYRAIAKRVWKQYCNPDMPKLEEVEFQTTPPHNSSRGGSRDLYSRMTRLGATTGTTTRFFNNIVDYLPLRRAEAKSIEIIFAFIHIK